MFRHLTSLVEEGELPVELHVPLVFVAFVEAAEVLVVVVPIQVCLLRSVQWESQGSSHVPESFHNIQ